MPNDKQEQLRGIPNFRGRAIGGLVAVAASLMALTGAVVAQTVQNGSFENVQTGQSASYSLTPGNTSVPGWTYGAGVGTARGCIVINDTFAPGCNGELGTITSGENPGFSPDGGNFLAVDVDTANTALISQTLAGLKLGTSYNISFYQASINNEAVTAGVEWAVSLGGTQLNATPVVMNPGFNSDTPWTAEVISFTATAGEIASPTLRFLAQTSISGGPPIALLDGVRIPEPASVALLGVGIAGLAGLRRRRAALRA